MTSLATKTRLLVCVSSSPLSVSLVRTAHHMAQQQNSDWVAIYVDSSHKHQSSLFLLNNKRLERTLALATELGATVVHLQGQSIADTIIAYAHQNNVKQIVVGRTQHLAWFGLWNNSVADQLLRQSIDIDVHIIDSGSQASLFSIKTPPSVIRWRAYFQAGLLIFLASFASWLMDSAVNLSPANLVMFYLLAVVIGAVRLGNGPAVLIAIVSVFAFVFLFVPPELTFQVAEAEYIITFVGLLVVGVVIANLAARAREQARAAEYRETQTTELYSLSRELSATVNPEMIIQSIILHITHTLECETAIYLPENNELKLKATSDNYLQHEGESTIAQWVFRTGETAGYQMGHFAEADNVYFPLKTAQSIVGVIIIEFDDKSTILNAQQFQLVNAFANQSALAIEATRLAEQKRQTEILREKERLQTALLNSISHDLRTPLVSITGALSSLRENYEYFDAETRRELLDGAWEDADRLNRLVGNLLDMSRLEAGTIKLKIDLYDLQEIIGVARGHLKLLLQNREVKIDLAPDLPLIPVDLVLIVQVLVNLLDNAVKYSRPNGAIGITASLEDCYIRIEILDEGIGIPEGELEHIFKRFHRARNSSVGGVGLGLSICEGIILAHDGKIWAENRIIGGTRFILLLPLTC